MKIYIAPSNQFDNRGVVNFGTEADRMNQVADVAVQALAGHTVIRATGTSSIASRAQQANQLGVQAYVSIHSNAGGGNARGTEVWCYPGSEQGFRLAQAVNARLNGVYPGPNRGIKTNSSFTELAKTDAPAIIIETAFHDNADDARWMIDNITTIGQAIADGVNDWAGRTVTTPPPIIHAAMPQPKDGPLDVDGIVGIVTISRYQTARRLSVDGEGGINTVTDMQNLSQAPWHDGRYDGQDKKLIGEYWPQLFSVRYGPAGSPSVKAMQRWLGTDPDGQHGIDDAEAFQIALNEGRVK
ncbi:MAG: N-acetylmuramoyl-L-alanine amidase [Propionibacteriaceae bacterium]|nr:N-acetylmuramoyl-L-alanine amidase [Propionibacteriaceae bacterium]